MVAVLLSGLSLRYTVTTTITVIRVLFSASRGMTGAGITHVIVKGERFVGVAGMDRAVLGTVSRGMTRPMDTTSVISTETRGVYETGKGHHARVVWKTGTVNAAQRTACLGIAMIMDITHVDLLMEWKSAFRRGLAPNVLSSAFVATMMRGIIFVRMTEVRRACMDGME